MTGIGKRCIVKRKDVHNPGPGAVQSNDEILHQRSSEQQFTNINLAIIR